MEASKDSQPPISDKVVTSSAKKTIDTYTLGVRKQLEDSFYALPPLERFKRRVEGYNRKLWYGLFKRLLNNPSNFKKIPVSQLRSVCIIPCGPAIGDMIVALPIARAVKRRNPSCRIGIITSDRNSTLLRCDSDIDEQYVFQDRRDLKHYPSIWRARKAKYDVVINMHFHRMSEYGLLANFLSPKGLKVTGRHARKDLYQILFNSISRYESHSMHLSQLGLEILEDAVDMEHPVLQAESRPTLQVCPDTRRKVQQQIETLLDEVGATWFIYFNTQASRSFREWGVENTAAFSRLFATRYPDGAIFFTASPVRQNEVKREIESHVFQRARFFETSYDLLEIAALAEASRLVITPDTSVIHFGCAMGRPTLVLWPDKGNLPLEWLPLQVPSRNLVPNIQGMPVSSIPVEEVWRATIDLLEGTKMTQSSFHPEKVPLDLYQASVSNEPLHKLLSRTLALEPDGSLHLPAEYVK